MSSSARTSDITDMYPHAASCDIQFRSFGKHRIFEGRIRTLRTLEDIGLIRQTLAQPSKGEVLVVDGGGSMHSALMGDMLAGSGVDSGWAGVVVYGAIRDSMLIDSLAIGVKALGTNPRRSAKRGDGIVDIPVYFGSVTFEPGHYLYSDEDGIVVLPSPADL